MTKYRLHHYHKITKKRGRPIVAMDLGHPKSAIYIDGVNSLRVTGCEFTGRGIKKLYTKITSKALLPRNSQLATRNELHHQV